MKIKSWTEKKRGFIFRPLFTFKGSRFSSRRVSIEWMNAGITFIVGSLRRGFLVAIESRPASPLCCFVKHLHPMEVQGHGIYLAIKEDLRIIICHGRIYQSFPARAKQSGNPSSDNSQVWLRASLHKQSFR